MNDITRYRTIGWDFDQTLWGHAKSKRFWKYIRKNPHSQVHYIITFRTGLFFDQLWPDLADVQCALRIEDFEKVVGIPEDIYRAFACGLKGGNRYLHWKGEVCRELGIECMIDDATMHVKPGCDMHQIALFHPDIIDV